MMWENITKGWKNVFDFTGRASRTEFWLFVLSGIVFYFLLTMLGVVLANVAPILAIIPLILFLIIFVIGSLSVTIRRTRDTGASPWLGVLAFLTGIFALIVGFIPTKELNNISASSNDKQKPSPEIKDFHYTPKHEAKPEANRHTHSNASSAPRPRLPLKDFN